MKTTLILLFSLISLCSFGQTNQSWILSTNTNWFYIYQFTNNLSIATNLFNEDYIEFDKFSRTIETNWVLESTIVPAQTTNITWTVYRMTGYTEVGTVTSNTFATVLWKNNPVKFKLESVEIGKTKRTRWE